MPTSSTVKSMVRLVKSSESREPDMLELVHMIDTGGQPELLETVPNLIQHSHLTVLVLNLVIGLNAWSTMKMGVAYQLDLPSHYSRQETHTEAGIHPACHYW